MIWHALFDGLLIVAILALIYTRPPKVNQSTDSVLILPKAKSPTIKVRMRKDGGSWASVGMAGLDWKGGDEMTIVRADVGYYKDTYRLEPIGGGTAYAKRGDFDILANDKLLDNIKTRVAEYSTRVAESNSPDAEELDCALDIMKQVKEDLDKKGE